MNGKILTIIWLIIAAAFFAIPLMAQDSIITALNNPPPEPEESGSAIVKPLSRLEFTLSLIVLAFGLAVIILEIILIRIKKIHTDETIKFITVTLIITSTLFLITAGYSNDQIAQAVGLLGTIAGYLLGKSQNTNLKEE